MTITRRHVYLACWFAVCFLIGGILAEVTSR